MSSYTKWDRAAYIERAGGEEEAERRRKVLMARQSGHQLAEERKRHGLTQAQLAQAMGVTPGRVSQIERGELATIDAVARYVQALGGKLDLIASFGDHTLGGRDALQHHGAFLPVGVTGKEPGLKPLDGCSEVPFDLLVEVEEGPAPPASEEPANSRGAHAAHTDQADPQLRLLSAAPPRLASAKSR